MWTKAELTLKAEWERGRTVVASVNRHNRLFEWAMAQGAGVYIGRQNGRYRLPQSKWANPYVKDRDGSVDECVSKYRANLMRQKDLLAALPELQGEILFCWCKPGACHGDILAALANKLPVAR